MEALFVILALISLIAALGLAFEDELGGACVCVILFVSMTIGVYATTNNNKKEVVEKTIQTTELELKNGVKVYSKRPIKYKLKVQTYKDWSVSEDTIISVDIIR